MSDLRSTAAVLKNSLRIEPAHYERNLPREQARELFRRHVELIEVETTSYCNRTCSFCPNAFIDRRSQKIAMPEQVWLTIVGDLAELDYDGTMVWSRYSEPLSEERIVERIRDVRAAAPRARLAINSNGDYLDPDYLRRIGEAGLDRLWVDVYMPDEEAYEEPRVRAHLDRFLKRIGRSAKVVRVLPELTADVLDAGLEMTVHVRNFTAMKRMDMSDRGGLLAEARRTIRVAPCYAPFKHLVVDWDGSVVVCCQLRSDAPKHAHAVVARLGEAGTGLVEAYVALADWRRSLRGFGPKAAPCASCNVSEYSASIGNRILGALLADEAMPGFRVLKRSVGSLIPKVGRP